VKAGASRNEGAEPLVVPRAALRNRGNFHTASIPNLRFSTCFTATSEIRAAAGRAG